MLTDLTIRQAHQGLKDKKFSSLELTKACLDRIKEKDGDISAFITVTEDLAIKQAKEVDNDIQAGKSISLLAGIPMAVKDNILVKDFKVTCGSKILENYVAPYDATVVKKLKEKGAVILGKTNLDEFGMGSSTENSAFFPTKNPHDLERVPGGSSGGSAAAVASKMCFYALGSDTGSSVRLPAAFCGIAGLYPTYGSVSRYGLVAFSSSLEQIGPLARSSEEVKDVFEVIRGKDEKDSTSLDYIENKFDMSKIKVGVAKESFQEGVSEDIKKAVNDSVKELEKKGVKIEEISLPNIRYTIPAYYICTSSEASSNLARFDGIKYGMSNSADNILDVYLKTRSQGFGDEVKRRIMLGTYALSSGYYDAYYLKAQKVRTLIIEDFKKAFKKVDSILLPTSPFTAFKLGEKTQDPLSMYLCDIFTAPMNLTGMPAISVPFGSSGNMPIGIQLVGDHFQENKIFEIAKLWKK